jgi:hypothetical protein
VDGPVPAAEDRSADGTDEPQPLWGPVYRAVLTGPPPTPVPASPAPENLSDTTPDTAPADVTESVPADLATLFRQEIGVDVSLVAVHRGRSVSRRAAALSARAFTQGGQVFLPDEVGDLTDRPVRALLAHELTHAVQQRVLGPAQPAPESAAGRELEDAGRWVELWVAGTGGPPPTLLHRDAGTRTTPVYPEPSPAYLPSEITQFAGAGATATAAEPAPTEPAPATSWTAENGFSTDPVPIRSAPVDTAATDWPTPSAWSPYPNSAGPNVGGAVATAFQEIADLRASMSELRTRDDRAEPGFVDLNDLASRIYHHIRTRLRAELIIDRERAGMLADIR